MADEEHGPSERQHCHSAAPVLRQVRLRAVEGWYVLCPPSLPHTWPVILPVCGEPSYHTKGLAPARCLVLCGSHKEGLPELNGKGCPNSGIAMSSKAMAFAGCLALEAPLARYLPQVTSLQPLPHRSAVSAFLPFFLSRRVALKLFFFCLSFSPSPLPGSCFNLSVAEMQNTQRAYFYRRFPILHLESGDWLPGVGSLVWHTQDCACFCLIFLTPWLLLPGCACSLCCPGLLSSVCLAQASVKCQVSKGLLGC